MRRQTGWAAIGLSAGLLWSTLVTAQQPLPEALAAAEKMLSVQARVGITEAQLKPMAIGSLAALSEASQLSAELKDEIATAAAKAALPRIPFSSPAMVEVFAKELTVDDLQALTAFFEGPVMGEMAAAQAKMKVEPGKPPDFPPEFGAVADKVAKFFESATGKKYMEVQMKNVALLQSAHMQRLMAMTGAVNDAVKAEVARRGVGKR